MGGAGGDVILAVAVAAAMTAVVMSLIRRGPGQRFGEAGAWIVLALTAAATLHVLILLLTGDYAVRYVWQHSASYQGPLRRMTALLAGQEGSFLVWALFANAVAVLAARRLRRGPRGDRSDAAVVHVAATAVGFGVLLVTAISRPFASFAAAFPTLDVTAAPVEGRGLNPVLANPWMPPHTVLTLAAYALIGLVFAVAWLHLLRAAQGRSVAGGWRGLGMQAGRWAWLLLTASLLTGMIWAYEEMTFGWFWSWDPVESSALAIWLVLTAALHAGRETGGGRRARVYAPLLGAASFVGVVFATFVTRSGLHPSVHAFAGGSLGPALGILVAVLVLAVACVSVAAAHRVGARRSPQPWLSWASIALLAGAGLVVWGLSYPIVAGLTGRQVELDTGFFALGGYLTGVALLLLLGFGLQAAAGRRRDAAIQLAFFALLTAVAAFVKLTGLFAVLPPAVYALFAIGERVRPALRRTGRGTRRAHLGTALAHAGAVIAFAGVTFGTLLSSTVTVGVDPDTGLGAADGIGVRVTAVDHASQQDRTGTLVEEREEATIEVWSSGRVVASGVATVSTYPERDMGRHARVMIHRGVLADTQVIYQGLAEIRADGVPVTVRRIPLINLAWAGLLLMVLGMLLMMRTPDRQPRATTIVERPTPERELALTRPGRP